VATVILEEDTASVVVEVRSLALRGFMNQYGKYEAEVMKKDQQNEFSKQTIYLEY
jgi:hypothetical protein